ncbi:hypothetical protein AVEN_106340-1 [Araneus ventricosus]|uniref:Uncharacterized protein n=1 Tax=Araneus ventricosus TaxID=182803 RepID=A0A4Y2AS58_ARAVE|nr:hypothetical protein AVEN_106340-1 [Araneus ventricosus]
MMVLSFRIKSSSSRDLSSHLRNFHTTLSGVEILFSRDSPSIRCRFQLRTTSQSLHPILGLFNAPSSEDLPAAPSRIQGSTVHKCRITKNVSVEIRTRRSGVGWKVKSPV